jgi:hypothetical protein
MTIPETITPTERAALVRRLHQIADMFNAVDARDMSMQHQFQLSHVKVAIEHTANCIAKGWDLTSEERNAA